MTRNETEQIIKDNQVGPEPTLRMRCTTFQRDYERTTIGECEPLCDML